MSQKPKKIQLKIDSCTEFPEKNCAIVFEIDGKQVGKSKEFVQNLKQLIRIKKKMKIFKND